MAAVEWRKTWSDYILDFTAPQGLPREGSPRIELFVEHQPTAVCVASAHFRLRRSGYHDEVLEQDFDQVVISSIEIKEAYRRVGLGSEIIRSLVEKFPAALFVGENPNDDATTWHSGKLERLFPTRMMQVSADGREVRVRPGMELDPDEV